MTTLDHFVSSPWSTAVDLHAYLCDYHMLKQLDPHLSPRPLAEGEGLLGVLQPGALAYSRYMAAQVQYVPGGPHFYFGSPAFVVGALLGVAARRRRELARLRRATMPRWHGLPLLRTVVTTWGLSFELATPSGVGWRHFAYDHITNAGLTGEVLTLDLYGMEPLRLTGPWAPWCAVLVAHQRFGPYARDIVPEVNRHIAA